MTPLAAALSYAAHGWPVFPIKHRSKAPITEHGFHDATLEPELIRVWWQRWPNAGIGIATGHGCDVLDIDGLEGRSTLLQVADELGMNMADWITSVSGRPDGGLHCWFAPTGLGRRIGFRPKLDWIGRRGYIIAPPSTHPSGNIYRWQRAPAGPLPEAPRVLLELVEPPKPVVRPKPGRPEWAHDGGQDLARLNGVLDQLEHAPEGERNNLLYWAACRLRELLDDGAPPSWEGLIVQAGVTIGLAENEARRTVSSGLKGEQRARN